MTVLRNTLAAGVLAASVLALPAAMTAQSAGAAAPSGGAVASVPVSVAQPCSEYRNPEARRACEMRRGRGY